MPLIYSRNWQFIRGFVTDAPSNWYTLRWHLFQGILDNLSEARFYSMTRNMFAWPTHFSCGLFTIQKLGTPCELKDGELYEKLLSVAGNDIAKDGHCFSNPGNFCVDGDGKLYLLDYASPVSQQVLGKYEEELRRKL